MATNVPDCLVLKIEEHDFDSLDLLATVYVFYDKRYSNFVIRGRKESQENNNTSNGDFSYNGDTVFELENFLSFVVYKKNWWSRTLYSCDNLPSVSEEITFENLTACVENSTELASYIQKKYSQSDLINTLDMVRAIYNYY
jgi:hypothetical protein